MWIGEQLMRKEKLMASGLAITPTAARAGRLAERMSLLATWAGRIVASRGAPVRGRGFGARLAQRFDTSDSLGARAAELSQRLTLEPIEVRAVEMSLAPFAPPLRQISAARQGAAEWRPAREPRLPPWARPPSENDLPPAPSRTQLLDELASIGWGQEPM
jgi:hypothetical protein